MTFYDNSKNGNLVGEITINSGGASGLVNSVSCGSALYADRLQVGKPPEKWLERYNFKFYDLNTDSLSADQRLVFQENYSVEIVSDTFDNKNLKIVSGFTFKYKEAIAEALKIHNEKNDVPTHSTVSFEDLRCVWIKIATVKF